MREIKFRQWSSDRFHYWGCNSDNFTSPLSNRLDIPSEQFTGLHDKNGKEIYEGDLIKYGSDAPLEVIYRESCFCYNQKSRYISRLQIFDNINKIEVIGNIHENPELLEGRE